MLIGMFVTFLLLLTHNGKKLENLPSAFELKHKKISNLEICEKVFKISEENGACLIASAKNFNEAQEMCNQDGMVLLEINSEEEKIKVYEETNKIFGSGGGTSLWVNGRWSSGEGEWLAVPRNEKFYLTTDHVELMSWGVVEAEGKCMCMRSFRVDKYHIDSCDCEVSQYFYCEYQ